MEMGYGVFAGLVVSVLVVLEIVALSLSYDRMLDTGYGGNEPSFTTAPIMTGSCIGASLGILLVCTLPALCYSCWKKKKEDKPNCCTPMYFVSIVIAGSISVIGTFIGGTLQIFALYIHQDILQDNKLSARYRAAAAFNFMASLYGIFVIVAVVCACLRSDKNWMYCKQRPKCIGGHVLALILITALLICISVASFLASSTSIFSQNLQSPNHVRASVASDFISGAAGFVVLGFLIGGPFICCPCYPSKYLISVLGVIMFLWGLPFLGTIVGGGLMMKVGQSFASDEVLDPDENLNRAPISAMAYYIGTVSLLASLTGMVLCIIGALFCKYRNMDFSESEEAEVKGKRLYVVIWWLFYREEMEVKIENVV